MSEPERGPLALLYPPATRRLAIFVVRSAKARVHKVIDRRICWPRVKRQ